ncbi:unnamed protein product [Trichobilharzia szidati]|nr:unnamed protein product [Trichobilharzia szidati]
MNPNYPSGLIGFGWNTGQNVTPAPRWEQPQIGFCFDSPNPPAPEVPPPIQNRGVVGFNVDQIPVDPPSAYSFPANNPQYRVSEDNFRNSVPPPPRPSIPPTIRSNSPKPYGGNDEYRSVTPTAPPEPSSIPISSSPSSEAVHVITISKPDPYKSRTNNTNTTSTTNSNRQLNRRDSYQDSLKDMAALMTDVELTDDVINGMRRRFDLDK